MSLLVSVSLWMQEAGRAARLPMGALCGAARGRHAIAYNPNKYSSSESHESSSTCHAVPSCTMFRLM